MKIHNQVLFPTAVMHVEEFITNKQVYDIFSYILSVPEKETPHTALTASSVSSHDLYNFNNYIHKITNNIPSCRNLEVQILEITNKLAEAYGYSVNSISNSWYNIQSKDSRLNPHKHPSSLISGALYINVDKHSSKIYFENPNPFISFTNSYNVTDFNHQSFHFTPGTGDLLIFPSWLTHHSGNDINGTDKRTVVSFNTL